MDKEQETGMAGLAEFWLWPFGMWKTATDNWLNYMTGFLGVDGRRDGKSLPQPLPGLAVDPWAILKIWMPQVDAVVEPVSTGSDDDAVRVRMRMQVPGLGAAEVVAIDAVVARESLAPANGPIIEADAVAKKVAAPRKAPVRQAAKPAVVSKAADKPAGKPAKPVAKAADAPSGEAAAAAPKPARRPRKPPATTA